MKNNRPLDKSKKSNIKCEHCDFWHPCEETIEKFGYTDNVCNNNSSKFFGMPREYYNRCKCFEWHERYDHPTEKGSVQE